MKKFILILMIFLLVGCSNTYEVNYGDLTLKLDKETASNIKDDELILNGNNYYASIKIYNDYKYEEINIKNFAINHLFQRKLKIYYLLTHLRKKKN